MTAIRLTPDATRAATATVNPSRDRVLIALAALTLVVFACLPANALAQQTTGTWETREWDRDDDRREEGWIYLNLRLDREDGSWNMGRSIDVADLRGITAAELGGTTGDVRFELVREAGTIVFEGDVRNGRGTGFFTFTPDSGYLSRMAQLGYGDLSDTRKFVFAAHDVTTQYVTELQDLGYRDLPENDLVKFVIHGVSVDFIRGMNGLGYSDIAAEQLVKLRIHGVSPDWVRRIRAALGS